MFDNLVVVYNFLCESGLIENPEVRAEFEKSAINFIYNEIDLYNADNENDID